MELSNNIFTVNVRWYKGGKDVTPRALLTPAIFSSWELAAQHANRQLRKDYSDISYAEVTITELSEWSMCGYCHVCKEETRYSNDVNSTGFSYNYNYDYDAD